MDEQYTKLLRISSKIDQEGYSSVGRNTLTERRMAMIYQGHSCQLCNSPLFAPFIKRGMVISAVTLIKHLRHPSMCLWGLLCDFCVVFGSCKTIYDTSAEDNHYIYFLFTTFHNKQSSDVINSNIYKTVETARSVCIMSHAAVIHFAD